MGLKICSVRWLAPRHRLVLGLLSLMLCSLACASGAGWYNNFEQAVQAARQQGRPIFVDFSTSWCSVCKQMDRTTLADPTVLARLDNFVKVKVDGDAFPQLCQAYGVEAYPTFVHLDPNGRVLDKRVGGMRVQEMAGALDSTLRTVSTSMAIAQAQRAEAQRKAAESKQESQKAQIASADLSISKKQEVEEKTQAVSREPRSESARAPRNGGGGSQPVLYNMSDSQLQGTNVYANEPTESSSRRSRFGSASNDGLRELAEATAKPSDAESARAASDEKSDKVAKKSDSDEKKSDDKKSDEKKPAVASNKKSESDSSENAKDDTLRAVATSANDLADSARETAAQQASPSPVIETRLASLSSESLPRPLLSRTAPGATQSMAPATTAQTGGDKASIKMVSNDALSSVRKGQRDDTGAAVPALPIKKIEIASAKSDEKRASDRIAKSSEKSDSKSEENAEKTSEGATKNDISRWMKDADTKLVDAHKSGNVQRKREARAMYNKVVEKDPENKFGRSDMAFIKMVSLIVDRDSDLLRRQAYTRIKEFEDRFPKSDHKDYYTLIRAILAADLGESSEVRELLADYQERFPESKYTEMAKDTLKSVSGSKKNSSKSSADNSKGKSKRSNG